MKNQHGFTLMEILVVIALTAILGLVLTNILTQVLRGQNKINTIDQVKQNGQLVMDKLSNEIRSAEKVICAYPESTNPNRIVLFKNGNYTRFKFVSPIGLANGFFSREDFTKDDFLDNVTYLTLCTESDTRGQFQLSYLTDKDNNGISIDYDNIGGVSQPIFYRQSQAGTPDIILIRFRASEGVNASGKTPENTVSEGGVLFTTAASVRGEK